MAECTGFENRKIRKGLGGSNPPASAIIMSPQGYREFSRRTFFNIQIKKAGSRQRRENLTPTAVTGHKLLQVRLPPLPLWAGKTAVSEN